ncbi:MAG: hypothetical protein ABIQ16_21315 [Polyangiaceae bacterium]
MSGLSGRLGCAALCVATGLIGCHDHVFLQVPTSQAPFAERAKAYQDLRPLNYQTSNNSQQLDFLELGNGTRVYHPEDLLVAVPRDSETARAIERSDELGKTAPWFGFSALACMVAGGTMIALSALGHERPNTTVLISGVGLGLAGGLGFGIASATVRGRSVDQARIAYDNYDRALQRKLSVCVDADCASNSVHERVPRPAPR